jgi:hypothetical protein
MVAKDATSYYSAKLTKNYRFMNEPQAMSPADLSNLDRLMDDDPERIHLQAKVD